MVSPLAGTSKFFVSFFRPGFTLPLDLSRVIALQIRYRRLVLAYFPPRPCERQRSSRRELHRGTADLSLPQLRGAFSALAAAFAAAALACLAEKLRPPSSSRPPTLTRPSLHHRLSVLTLPNPV